MSDFFVLFIENIVIAFEGNLFRRMSCCCSFGLRGLWSFVFCCWWRSLRFGHCQTHQTQSSVSWYVISIEGFWRERKPNLKWSRNNICVTYECDVLCPGHVPCSEYSVGPDILVDRALAVAVVWIEICPIQLGTWKRCAKQADVWVSKAASDHPKRLV